MRPWESVPAPGGAWAGAAVVGMETGGRRRDRKEGAASRRRIGVGHGRARRHCDCVRPLGMFRGAGAAWRESGAAPSGRTSKSCRLAASRVRVWPAERAERRQAAWRRPKTCMRSKARPTSEPAWSPCVTSAMPVRSSMPMLSPPPTAKGVRVAMPRGDRRRCVRRTSRESETALARRPGGGRRSACARRHARPASRHGRHASPRRCRCEARYRCSRRRRWRTASG